MDENRARGERLRDARKRAGLSVDQVAQRAGRSASGVRAIENGQNGLRPDAAELLAPILGVSVAWLLTGAGETKADPMVPIIGRVGADNSGEIIQADERRGYDMAPIPPGGSPNAAALEVIGDSMPWLAPDGALVYFERQNTPPTQEMVYYYVIAELEDGRVLLKRLLRGSAPDLWTLESQIGPPIENVRIKWAAEPTAIIPPRQAQRIIRRAGHSQVA